MKYADLVNTLEAAGKPAHTVDVGGGTHVLLLPHGGRVLGLFGPKDGENFYWTHPALQSPDSARKFYTSGAWENSGGDRTWLSPEADIFFPRYPDVDLSGYFQPRQLDPGSYQAETSDRNVRLVNRLSLPLYRSKVTVELEIAKWVEPTANPLRHERSILREGGVEFAGYEQHTTLQLLNGSSARIGLWNLIQMPHGGDMVVPTYSKTNPRIYFGEIAAEDLIARDYAVRWRMRAKGEQKIGIRAAATTGRAGYLYERGGETSLVIRNFVVNPAGEYIDTPWMEPEDLGYSVQACNVDSHLGSFSELEYHVPAIGGDNAADQCEDVSQVWAFRGTRDAIAACATYLLGPLE